VRSFGGQARSALLTMVEPQRRNWVDDVRRQRIYSNNLCTIYVQFDIVQIILSKVSETPTVDRLGTIVFVVPSCVWISKST
jgi:hypothetical protein